jgi:hypothetical protein
MQLIFNEMTVDNDFAFYDALARQEMTEQDLVSGDELHTLIQTGQARMVGIARR